MKTNFFLYIKFFLVIDAVRKSLTLSSNILHVIVTDNCFKMSRATRLYLVLLLIGAAYFVFILVEKNRAIHAENKCAMTFMYRRIYLTVGHFVKRIYSALAYSSSWLH